MTNDLEKISIFLVCVDDMIITSDDEVDIIRVKKRLSDEFGSWKAQVFFGCGVC